MNCVIITLSFPFGTGDRFLKEEIPVIAKEFKKIYIIPLSKPTGEMNCLPANVEVCLLKSNKFLSALKTGLNIRRIMSEMIYAIKTEETKLVKILHRILLYEFRYQSSKKSMRRFGVHECIFYAYWLSEPAYFLTRYKEQNPGAFCVSRAHGYDCFKYRGYNPFRREIAENIDIIYSISQKGKDDLEKNLVHRARNSHQAIVKVSHLGVNYSDETNPLKQDEQTFRIVSCSNVVAIKRIDILLNAVKLVKCESKRLEWIHFGGGPLLETFRQNSKNEVESNNKHISFPGETEHEKILQFYREKHVDLFINCSDSEGIPVSVMEAMGNGIPCIARDVGGISELIDNNVNGVLLPEVTDAKMLASTIEEMMCKEDQPDMRKNAKEKIKEYFSNKTNYHDFAQEIVAECLKNGRYSRVDGK